MAKKLSDIRATNWQLSNRIYGELAEGIEDIRQCIQTILTTTKGSDAFRPLFGSDIWRHIDRPVTQAAPNISAEIIDAVGKWENRINIIRLLYDVDVSRIDYALTVEMVQSGETTEILFYIDRQTQIDPPSIGRAFSNGFSFGFS